jgi:hypothetical protein
LPTLPFQLLQLVQDLAQVTAPRSRQSADFRSWEPNLDLARANGRIRQWRRAKPHGASPAHNSRVGRDPSLVRLAIDRFTGNCSFSHVCRH